MRICLQEPSGHWGSGQFVYIQAPRTKKSFPTTADRHSHQMKPSSKAAISSDVHVSTVGSTQSVMWHQPAVTFSSRRDMQAPQTTLSTQVPLVWEAGFSHCPQLQPHTWDLHFNLASDLTAFFSSFSCRADTLGFTSKTRATQDHGLSAAVPKKESPTEGNWRCKAQRTQNPRLSSHPNTRSEWWAWGEEHTIT